MMRRNFLDPFSTLHATPLMPPHSLTPPTAPTSSSNCVHEILGGLQTLYCTSTSFSLVTSLCVYLRLCTSKLLCYVLLYKDIVSLQLSLDIYFIYMFIYRLETNIERLYAQIFLNKYFE